MHLCTVADFDAFCDERGFDVLERVVLRQARRVSVFPNLFGVLAIYRFRHREAVTSPVPRAAA
jgi:hypothetical protein